MSEKSIILTVPESLPSPLIIFEEKMPFNLFYAISSQSHFPVKRCFFSVQHVQRHKSFQKKEDSLYSISHNKVKIITSQTKARNRHISKLSDMKITTATPQVTSEQKSGLNLVYKNSCCYYFYHHRLTRQLSRSVCHCLNPT